MNEIRTDVVVVGAGLAGLVAARDVVAAGREAVVLEARDRVGGRICNHPIPGGEVVEVGGQWIGPTQDRIAALAADLGVDTFPTYDEGRSIFWVSGSSRESRGEAPPIEPDTLTGIGEAFARLEAMAAELPPEAPWRAPSAEEWDSQTVHTWMVANVRGEQARRLFKLVVSALMTAEPAELSLLHLLFYIRSGGSLALLTDVVGGAQERRFVGGSQLVAIKLADRLGDRVILSSPVRRLSQDARGVVVESEAARVTARRTVVAVPIPLADRIVYAPPLPGFRSQMHQRMAPGATIKINAVYERPFWRDAGLNGRAASDEGPVTLTFDNSPPSGVPGVLCGFVEGDDARRFARLSVESRRKEALASFARYFGEQAATPIEYIEKDWSDEEWTRGCYGANFPPGGWTRYGEALREPFGRVHWAGAETATIWMNYMDGAVRSGQRAASEVLAAL